MSEGKTLFAIAMVMLMLSFIVSSVLGDLATKQCASLGDPKNANLMSVINAILFDPCMAEYSWFSWLLLTPLALVAILVLKKLLFI